MGMKAAPDASGKHFPFFAPCARREKEFFLHVANRIEFGRLPRLWAVGKNTTVFVSRANRYMSCG